MDDLISRIAIDRGLSVAEVVANIEEMADAGWIRSVMPDVNGIRDWSGGFDLTIPEGMESGEQH